MTMKNLKLKITMKNKKIYFEDKKIIPTEANEQMALVQWLELKGLKFSSIPNNTYTTSWKQKRKNKDTGLRAGLPDLLICLPNKLLFCELKREKGGTLSPYQREWIHALNRIGGTVEAIVCFGADEAIKEINNRLQNMRKTLKRNENYCRETIDVVMKKGKLKVVPAKK